MDESVKAKITKLDTGTISSLTNRSTCTLSCGLVYVPCGSGDHNASNVEDWGKCKLNEDDLPYAYESCNTICEEEMSVEVITSGSGGGGDSSSDVITTPMVLCEGGNNDISSEGLCLGGGSFIGLSSEQIDHLVSELGLTQK